MDLVSSARCHVHTERTLFIAQAVHHLARSVVDDLTASKLDFKQLSLSKSSPVFFQSVTEYFRYNHEEETTFEDAEEIMPEFSAEQRSKEDIILTFPPLDISHNHSASGPTEAELGERTEGSSSPVPEGISEVDLIPSGAVSPLIPNLEDSIKAIHQNGLLGQYSAPGNEFQFFIMLKIQQKALQRFQKYVFN